MGSLYSLSPVYTNYKHIARKPARQQIHEALSKIKGGWCDLCLCMCLHAQLCEAVCLCKVFFVVCCGCKDTRDDGRCLSAALCVSLCICVFENFLCGGIFISVNLKFQCGMTH